MQDNNKEYYAHGKLLLTAEYFVLHGAKAIALPLQYGQRMDVTKGRQDGILSWKAFMQEGLWFSCDFRLPDFEIVNSSDPEKAIILQDVFRAILQMNPAVELGHSLDVHTRIDFHNQWGLGSSSTLIANLANWAGVDAFRLNEMIFNGSGFDIACATADGPIFYRRNELPEPVILNYPFLDNLYFIYSGSKKSTRNEVRRFLNGGFIPKQEIEQMDFLSEQIAWAGKLDDFQKLIDEHEKLVSALLHVPTVKSSYFNDFDGEVKSLGAWGGDFYLVATTLEDRDVLHYFKEKGLRVVFPWKELVLNRKASTYVR
ncbi:MAG: GYDIA family GHMP kinase [Prolixibacteraceae bacterium]